jgi:uncharacterized protein YcbK (DUF882 family)
MTRTILATTQHGPAPTRRRFLTGLGAAAACAALPLPAFAAAGKKLTMINANTLETFSHVMGEDGTWYAGALEEFRHFARDWRTDKERDIDTRVITTAMTLHHLLGATEPMLLISGYRSPETNKTLHGASPNSLHMEGAAMDLRQPGRSNEQLHRAAVSLGHGGVGKYTREQFVHVDCGRIRHWGV